MTTSDDAVLAAKIDTALHPERNGLLLKNAVAEGASHEHVIKQSLMQLITQHTEAAVQAAREDTIWNIMSPKTEGLFDGGDLFIKRAPIEQAIINMVGLEKWKAMQEAVDAQLQADAVSSGEKS